MSLLHNKTYAACVVIIVYTQSVLLKSISTLHIIACGGLYVFIVIVVMMMVYNVAMSIYVSRVFAYPHARTILCAVNSPNCLFVQGRSRGVFLLSHEALN